MKDIDALTDFVVYWMELQWTKRRDLQWMDSVSGLDTFSRFRNKVNDNLPVPVVPNAKGNVLSPCHVFFCLL